MFVYDRKDFPSGPAGLSKGNHCEAGFTLIEAVIALLLMMIVALGSASLFSFSIYNNSGGSDRATSLAIAQEALEVLRSAQFNATTTDASLNGGTTVQAAVVRDGRTFRVTRTIDDLPSTAAVDIDATTTLKGITVSVVPQSIGQGWAFGAGGTVTLMTQRSKTDR
ncbi:MAG TPA: prepilin-type N-terminal cleavage/methylation domain-containing protein [Pyrinomonadaceae bacterium]|nr:prepilin-type N-terminal cleavage/methylation domain-containing protein [Pyrinomonadaceae bacterium]